MKMGLLRQLVVFSILMENNEGIVGKSPTYIFEKFNSAMSSGNMPQELLDHTSLAKFNMWCDKWRFGGEGGGESGKSRESKR